MNGAIYHIEQIADGPKISIEKVFKDANIEIPAGFRVDLKNGNVSQQGACVSLTADQAKHLRQNGFNVRLQMS